MDETRTTDSQRHDDHCPACGRFVPAEDAFFDLPPDGGHQVVGYCDERCAEDAHRYG